MLFISHGFIYQNRFSENALGVIFFPMHHRQPQLRSLIILVRILVLAACCVSSQGCLVRSRITYWDVSGSGYRGTPPYEYDGGGCSSSHRPRYMNFTLTHGVTVSYGYGGALVGHIFVPPGVTARFVDGVATAHTDSGAKVHGTIVDLTRRIYDRRNLPEVLSPTSPLIGWTKDQLMNSGQLRPDARPSGDGSAQILTWNHFEFVVVFESELDSEFSVLLPALEIDGEHASVSDLRFTKKMIGEWTLQPCV